MPKIQIRDFSGGENTRLDKRRIAENQGQEAVDVDLSGAKLKPVSGTDTTTPPTGDYQFRSTWITDEDAETFTESGNTIVKSYPAKNPEFQAVDDTGALTTTKSLGVPNTPTAPQIELQSTGSAKPTDFAALFHSAYVETLATTTTATNAGTGDPTTRITSNASGIEDIDPFTGTQNLVSTDGGFYKDPSGGFSTFNAPTLTRWNSSYSQTLSPTTITHYNRQWFFKGNYFIGISQTGITKVNVTNGTVTNHTYATPSWPILASPEESAGSTLGRDGYKDSSSVPTINTTSEISGYSDGTNLYISTQYSNGIWGFNHVQRHPDQNSSFPAYGPTKYRLQGGYYYVILIFDPASIHRSQSVHPMGTSYNSILEGFDKNNNSGYYSNTMFTGSPPPENHPTAFMSNCLHWGIASVGTTHASGSTMITPEITNSPTQGRNSVQSGGSFSFSSYSLPCKGLYHGNHDLTVGNFGTSFTSKSASPENRFYGGICYVPSDSKIDLAVGPFPMYIWKCGTVERTNYGESYGNMGNNTGVGSTAYTRLSNEALNNGGENCYSINNTSENCTDFYWRAGARQSQSSGSQNQPQSSGYGSGQHQLRVFHTDVDGAGLTWKSYNNTENVKFSHSSDEWSFFDQDSSFSYSYNYSQPSSGGTQDPRRDETGVHKLALSASNSTATTVYVQSLPDYKISQDTFNWVTTPWHQVYNIKESTYYNFGASLTGSYSSTNWSWDGFQSNYPIQRKGDVKIAFPDNLRHKVTTNSLTPYIYTARWPTRSSSGWPNYPTGTPRVYDSVNVYFGVASIGSLSDNYLVTQTIRKEYTVEHEMFACDNGILIKGGDSSSSYNANTIVSRPLHSSFHTSSTFTKVVQSHQKFYVDSDKIAFYDPNLDILTPNSTTYKTQSDYNISDTIRHFQIFGSITGGHIAYATTNFANVKILQIPDTSGSGNDNSNRVSVYNLPMSRVLDISGTTITGTKYDLTDGREENLTTAYVWYLDEIILATATIGNVACTTVSALSKKTDPSKKYIWISSTGGVKSYTTATLGQLTLALSGSRNVVLTITPEVFSRTLPVAISSSSASTGWSQADIRTIQEGDIVTIGSFSSKVASKSGTTINFSDTTSQSLNASVTFTRYVSKNSGWFKPSDFGLINVPSSFPTYGATYTVAEKLEFSANTSVDFIPINKYGYASGGTTTGEFAFDEGSPAIGGTYEHYFKVDFDKNMYDGSNNPIGSATKDNWSVSAPGMYSTSSNVDYQYKIALLRNIGSTVSPAYIESSASEDSNIVSLVGSSNYIKILGSSLDIAVTGQHDNVQKIRIYRVGGLYASYGWLKDVDIQRDSSGNVISQDDIDDMSQVISSTALTPYSLPAPPPSSAITGEYLQFITYVSGLFFGAYGSKLRISEFGNPHSWPILGEYDVDSSITGVLEYHGEALVWTKNSTYIARGSAYDDINISKIPDRQGLPLGNKNSVVEVQGAVFWISNDGICMYSNGQINVISQSKFSQFPSLTGVKSGVKDNIMYFFTSSGQGIACDLRTGNPSFTRITENVDKRVYYSQLDDRLYLSKTTGSGSYGEGTDKSLTFKTRAYDFGDSNEYKIYTRGQVTYTGSGTVTFIFDGSAQDAFTLSSSLTEITKYLEYTSATTARTIEVSFSGSINVIEVGVEGYPLVNYSKEVRWESADITYQGAPTLAMFLDGASVTVTPSLPSSALVNLVRVYFPSSTVGHIPHYRNTGSGDIMEVNYNTSEL